MNLNEGALQMAVLRLRRVGGNSAVAEAASVFVSGNQAFMASWDTGLFILNLHTPVSLAVAPQPGPFGVSIQGLAGVQVELERSLDLIHWQKWTNGVLGSTPLTFFNAADASHGDELWNSDGTESGTVLVK